MHDLLLPDFTLRYHKSNVTTLLVFHLSEEPAPVLLSGDATGVIVLWDLITRRPIANYRIANDPQIVAFQYLEPSLVAVLCKDHKLRILCIESLPRWKQVYEIPVNTLNFANFLLQKLESNWFRLICCNTEDSEAIDVYIFHLSNLNSLKRVHKKLRFFEKVAPLVGDELGLEKLGIVMRFVELDGVIYCGLESGFVIGFKFFDSVSENFDDEASQTSCFTLEIVYISNANYPNPILDLCAAPGYILSSSTDDKVGIHKWQQLCGLTSPNIQHSSILENELKLTKNNFKRIPVTEVSHLKQLDDCLLLGSWSGETTVLDRQDALISKFVKSKSMLEVTENSKGNLQGNGNVAKSGSRNCKISSLEGISGAEVRKGTDSNLLDPPIQMGRRRRVETFMQSSWCIIGYDDGSIAFYRLKSAN